MIGLGLLGTALAERLIQAGYPTVVNNRTREKAKPLEQLGATWSENPFEQCDHVVLSLYTTETVEAVLEQMDSGLRAGQVLIDTTTGSPQQTAALGAKLAERDVHYLESPIAASSEQTRQGKALTMVAGEEDVFKSCHELYAAIAEKAFYLGTWGNAAMMKLVNNLVLGLTRAALAEGLVLGRRAGLDVGQVLNVLKQGNAYSVVMDVKGEKMCDTDFSPQAKLAQHNKDVRLILEESQRLGAKLPFSKLHHEVLNAAEAAGLGDLDNSAVIQAIDPEITAQK